MLGSEFHFREKIPVGVIAASSLKGQKIIELLSRHWFKASVFSDAEMGKSTLNYSLIIDLSDNDVSIGKITSLAKAGYSIVTNNSAFSLDTNIPLLVPEINKEQLDILKKQVGTSGKIVAIPNSASAALSITLKPLLNSFGIDKVLYKGPEKNVEAEVLKALGENVAKFEISSQDSLEPSKALIKLKRKVGSADLIEAWESFKGQENENVLPSAYKHGIRYFENGKADKEAAVNITNLRFLEGNYDFEFDLSLPDNLTRMVIAAELMVRMGYVYW